MRIPLLLLLCFGSLFGGCGKLGSGAPRAAERTVSPSYVPGLRPLPESTQAASVSIAGFVRVPGSSIRVDGAAEILVTDSAADGSFELDVPLLPDRLNYLFVTEFLPGGAQGAVHPLTIVQGG